MSARSPNITAIPLNLAPGAPLQPWTYDNIEVFDLKYEALLLRHWQFPEQFNSMLPDSGSVRPVFCIGLVQKVALIPLIISPPSHQ